MRSLAPLAVLVIALAAAGTASARPNYPGFMPNGTAIDGRGCINCHTSSQGGGSRNAFGNAMQSAGIDWSSVCHSDSDGDGQTNGQELGDPDCIWQSGAAARSTAISNPGKASSTSSNPTGGAVTTGGGEGEGEGEGEGATQPTCPAHAHAQGTGCACDTGFQPNSAGTACVAVTTGGEGEGEGATGSTGTPEWMCDPTWQGDGDCDCGCGAPDPDCADNDINTCTYNDCDTWQSTQGLDPDATDPTLCAGGDPPTFTGGTGGTTGGGEGEGEGATGGGEGEGGGTVGSGCPANSSPSADNTSCSCNSGYHPDSSHTICLLTQASGGEGETGGEGEGEGGAVTCGDNQVASGGTCTCANGFVLDNTGNCVVAEAREGEGEGEGSGAGPYTTSGCDSDSAAGSAPVAAMALAFLALARRRRRALR